MARDFLQWRWSCVVGLVAAILASWVSGAHAAAGDAMRYGPTNAAKATWVTNGRVDAQALSADGQTLYIGGTFTRVGPTTGAGASIDPTTGGALSFPRVNGTIDAIEADGAGGAYIAGTFTVVDDHQRNRLAHVLADGTLDLAFNADVNGMIYDIELAPSGLWISGSFSTVGGTSRGSVASINPTTGAVNAWSSVGTTGTVDAIAVTASTVYVGGSFSMMGGQSRSNLAALDASTGAVTSWNPSPGGWVRALSVASGTLYVGGLFTTIAGQPRNRLAAFDTTTHALTSWDPAADSWVHAVVATPTAVYVGGLFGSVGGAARSRVAMLDPTTGVATAFSAAPDEQVSGLSLVGTTLYVSGMFSTIGGQPRNRIAALDSTTGAATSWNPDASGPVSAVAGTAGRVWIGGSVGRIGGTARQSLAAIDIATGAATSWNPGANGRVNTLLVNGATVYAGGIFTTAGGQARNRIAALDASTGLATSWNPNASGEVHALALSGMTLYVGGAFGTIGGQTRLRLAALDTTSGTASAWNPGAASSVYALALGQNVVYAGGLFTTIGGQPRNYVAALDATTGLATGWNPNADSSVRALATTGSTIYIGGSFGNVGGQARQRIAALDAVTGVATGWSPAADGTVNAIAADGNLVYAGGTFSTIGGQARNRLAALDATSALPTAWNPSVTESTLRGHNTSNSYHEVKSLLVTRTAVHATGAIAGVTSTRLGGLASFPRRTIDSAYGSIDATALSSDAATLYVAGSITGIGETTGSFARLATTGARDGSWPNVNGGIQAMAADGTGGWYIGGSFSKVGDAARSRLAHILADGTVDPAWNPGANNTVNVLAVSGGTVYAGGWFTTLAGQPRATLGALDAVTGAATSWNPGASGGQVEALAVGSGVVYVGGTFTTAGGQARNRIAAIDTTTGLATAWDPNASGLVDTITVSGTTIYAGGTFTTIGGQTRNNIAALDAAGAATAWDPNASAAVKSITVAGGLVYVGGSFTTIGGQTRSRIAAVDPATALATAWNPNAVGPVNEIVVAGPTAYVAGGFSTIGGQARGYLAAISLSTGLATSWNPTPSNIVYALGVTGSTVYAGGVFASTGGVARGRAAAIDTATGVATSWNPNATSPIYALATRPGVVYAGGLFTTIGGQARNRIAALDASTALATAWNPNADGTVNSLAVDGSRVYAGGAFATIGGQARARVAALDSTSALATAWNPSADNTVNTIAATPTTVYVGGTFSNTGGQARSRIAAIDAATGAATAWNPAADNTVETIIGPTSGSLYVGGAFANIGGQARSRIAAIDATSGSATAWNPGASSTVTSIAINGSVSYVGGMFTTLAGQSRLFLGAADASSGASRPWNPLASGSVESVAAAAGVIYAGGSLNSSGGESGSVGALVAEITAPPSVGDGPVAGTELDGNASLTAFPGWWAPTAHPELAGYDSCVTLSSSGADCGAGALRTWTRTTATSTPASGLTLAEGTTYYTCVRSIDAAGGASPATCSDGAIVDLQLPSIALVSPANGSGSASRVLSATYSDPAPGSFGRVEFEVCTSADCSSVVETGQATGLAPSATGSWSHSRPAGTWYWRARAVDAANQASAWSTVRSYAYGAPPGVPVLISPAAGAWTTTTSPTLSASYADPDGETGRITFELCRTSAASPWSSGCASGYQPVTSASVSDGATAAVLPVTELGQGDWYWRASARDAGGAISAASADRLLRVDSLPPTSLTGVSITRSGLGKVLITWNASIDAGIGGVTYSVDWSGDGSAFAPVCTNVSTLSCEQAGLAGISLPFVRIRACDALATCTTWEGRMGGSATGYFLRTSIESAAIVGTADKAATLTNATGNIVTSQRLDGGEVGWVQLRPAAANITNPVPGEPAGTPAGGYGWIVDASAGSSIAAGAWSMTVTTDSDSDGVGRIQCRAWIVSTTAGAISASANYQSAYTDSGDVLEAGQQTHTCQLPGLATQTSLAANQYVYVELLLDVSVSATGSNKRLSIVAEGAASALAIPEPGLAPATPLVTAPALDDATVGFTASYSHPASLGGAIEYQFAADASFVSILHAGTGPLMTSGSATTFSSEPLAAGSYAWRARARSTNGLTSAWTTGATTVSRPPAAPVAISPSDGGGATRVRPVLRTGAFADPDTALGDTHVGSQYQLAELGYAWSTGQDSGQIAATTSWTVVAALTPGLQYQWRARYVDAYGTWSAWSTTSSFEVVPETLSLSVSTAALSLGTVSVGQDTVGSFTASVATNADGGYVLTASGSAAGTLGASCACADPLLDWSGTGAVPTTWPSGTTGHVGITVRDADGGRLAKWGPGTATGERDFVANRYAAIDPAGLTLHARSAGTTGPDPVLLTWRVAPAPTTTPTTHTETLSLTATANP